MSDYLITDAEAQFWDDVRVVVLDHFSGLPEHRPEEAVWARLDAILYTDDHKPRPEPDFSAIDGWSVA